MSCKMKEERRNQTNDCIRKNRPSSPIHAKGSNKIGDNKRKPAQSLTMKRQHETMSDWCDLVDNSSKQNNKGRQLQRKQEPLNSNSMDTSHLIFQLGEKNEPIRQQESAMEAELGSLRRNERLNKNTIRQLQTENISLKQRVASCAQQDDKSTWMGRDEHMEEELQRLQETKAKLEETICKLEMKVAVKDETIRKLFGDIEGQKKEIANKENIIQDLKKRVSGSAQQDDKCAAMIAEIGILKGKERSMEDELHRLQKAKADLEGTILKLEIEIADKDQNTRKLAREIEGHNEEMANKDSVIHDLNKRLDGKEEDLGKLRNEKEVQNSENRSLLRKKDQAIEDLTKRLSSEMNTKISSDESSLENVSIKDRPMNIATEYDLLCSNEWLAAKTALDELLPDADEEVILKFLCGILTTALAESCKLKQVMLTGVKKTIYKPGAQAGLESDKVPGRDVPENLMQQLMDLLRKTVEDTDLTVLFQAINTEIGANSKSPFTKTVIESEKMAAYIKATGVVTWKMVLQRPEMTFRQDGIDGKYQGEKKQEVFWKSSDPSNPNSKVKFYVQPALYHGDAMMVKGRVFLSTE